ncbi:hypothetical protein HDU76_003680, partial [Blyttiomyces sp. JEL0837]
VNISPTATVTTPLHHKASPPVGSPGCTSNSSSTNNNNNSSNNHGNGNTINAVNPTTTNNNTIDPSNYPNPNLRYPQHYPHHALQMWPPHPHSHSHHHQQHHIAGYPHPHPHGDRRSSGSLGGASGSGGRISDRDETSPRSGVVDGEGNGDNSRRGSLNSGNGNAVAGDDHSGGYRQMAGYNHHYMGYYGGSGGGWVNNNDAGPVASSAGIPPLPPPGRSSMSLSPTGASGGYAGREAKYGGNTGDQGAGSSKIGSGNSGSGNNGENESLKKGTGELSVKTSSSSTTANATPSTKGSGNGAAAVKKRRRKESTVVGGDGLDGIGGGGRRELDVLDDFELELEWRRRISGKMKKLSNASANSSTTEVSTESQSQSDGADQVIKTGATEGEDVKRTSSSSGKSLVELQVEMLAEIQEMDVLWHETMGKKGTNLENIGGL